MRLIDSSSEWFLKTRRVLLSMPYIYDVLICFIITPKYYSNYYSFARNVCFLMATINVCILNLKRFLELFLQKRNIYCIDDDLKRNGKPQEIQFSYKAQF